MINIIIKLILGAFIGWLAGVIMKSKGSVLRNIILGIIGSFVGGVIAQLIGISANVVSLGGILISTAGACLVIWLVRLIIKK